MQQQSLNDVEVYDQLHYLIRLQDHLVDQVVASMVHARWTVSEAHAYVAYLIQFDLSTVPQELRQMQAGRFFPVQHITCIVMSAAGLDRKLLSALLLRRLLGIETDAPLRAALVDAGALNSFLHQRRWKPMRAPRRSNSQEARP